MIRRILSYRKRIVVVLAVVAPICATAFAGFICDLGSDPGYWLSENAAAYSDTCAPAASTSCYDCLSHTSDEWIKCATTIVNGVEQGEICQTYQRYSQIWQ